MINKTAKNAILNVFLMMRLTKDAQEFIEQPSEKKQTFTVRT
jgi:hypothetical protein